MSNEYRLPKGNRIKFEISGKEEGDRPATDEDFERHFEDKAKREEAKEIFSTYNEITKQFKG